MPEKTQGYDFPEQPAGNEKRARIDSSVDSIFPTSCKPQ
jgi:hypothetical protein